MKKLLTILLLCIFTAFTLISCGNETCETCTDGDLDGRCDSCGAEVKPEEPTPDTPEEPDAPDEPSVPDKKPEPLALITDSISDFTFVIADELPSSTIRVVDDLIRRLKGLGIEVEKVYEGEKINTNYEVIVGKVRNRPELYSYEPQALGAKGYAVRIVGSSITVIGATNDSLVDAIEYFTEYGLGITSKTKNLKNATFTAEKEKEYVYSDYNVTDVLIDGKSIKNHVIATDSVKENKLLAEKIRDILFLYAGIYPDIVPLEDHGDHYIAIYTPKMKGGEGFEIHVRGTNLEICSDFPYKTVVEGENYFNQKLALAVGPVGLTPKTVNLRDITYEAFGAKGDGKTDDSAAIRQTHEHANKYGHTVIAGKDKTYYIPAIDATIPIMTDVNFSNATFIFDDISILPTDAAANVSIFTIKSDYGVMTLGESSSYVKAINDAGGIKADECNKLSLGLGYPAMIHVYNDDYKNYIVYGPNQTNGSAQVELILLDENGNIDPKTPFIFDYEKVTRIKVFRVDDERITLEGGKFITRANNAESDFHFYDRNILVQRPNTVIRGLTYEITDEPVGETASNPYRGFIMVSNTHNTLIENCILQSHRYYYGIGSGGSKVNMGTYTLNAGLSNEITWKNCTQSNFFEADGKTLVKGTWGIMGSGFCKNLNFVDSLLTRFDAHAGVHNVKIINTEIVHLRFDGSGEFLVENCIIHNDLLLNLREDYGSFWDGKITIKNTTVYNSGDVTVVSGAWTNHFFGYPTMHPTVIEIDGLKLQRDANIIMFRKTLVDQSNDILKDEFDVEQKDEEGNYTGEFGKMPNLNPTAPTEKIIIKNNDAGYLFVFPDVQKYPFFENMEIIIE